jgi:hypothetical protein
MSYELRGKNLKDVGDDDEDRSENEMPLVFVQVFIKVPEFFHAVKFG